MVNDIALGTTSEDKYNIVKDCLVSAKLEDSNVVRYNVSSGISDQPLSDDETAQGSKNRAKNAYGSAKAKTGLIGIGMEGGLAKIDDVYNLVCYVSIYDGKSFYLGRSEYIPLPKKVSMAVESGQGFGDEIRKYARSHNDSHNLKCGINELITRNRSFTSAINQCFNTWRINR